MLPPALEAKKASVESETDRTMTEKNRKIPEPLYCPYFCYLLFLSHHLIVKPKKRARCFLQDSKEVDHFILCHPLLLLPSIFPWIRVFYDESVLHTRWPKYWSFSFIFSPSNEHPGLISFRMN